MSMSTELQASFREIGFVNVVKIAETLQGSIYTAVNKATKESLVIKMTSKYLHKYSIASVHDQYHKVKENILSEASILKHISEQSNAPLSIVKYCDFLQCDKYYYLIMENGGSDLFSFVLKAHRLISAGNIEIIQWHKAVKVIFSQLIECIEFLHSQNICHYDISLENVLINDVDVQYAQTAESGDEKIEFICDTVQIKLIDFGLSEIFKSKDFKTNKYCGKSDYKSPEVLCRKAFDAGKNDLWCVGVTLFMMIVGSRPWHKAEKCDTAFDLIMNGGITQVLEAWDKMEYVSNDLIDLFESFFQYENNRICLSDIKTHAWLKK